ncbi:MAG TPA: protein kinase, partial [Gammaproteobacteria bacterium]|nr:protein kinase [Gammaproteobacteria bacterium]
MGTQNHRNALKPGYMVHWYRIERILGQGGFGITYLAEDTNLNQQVAVKEYLPVDVAVRERDFSVHPVSEDHSESFAWGLERFVDEARTLARFDHPNIVRVLSVFEMNNSAYMVMRYERGRSLQQMLSKRATLEEDRLIEI